MSFIVWSSLGNRMPFVAQNFVVKLVIAEQLVFSVSYQQGPCVSSGSETSVVLLKGLLIGLVQKGPCW
jgi:hypothetical protein